MKTTEVGKRTKYKGYQSFEYLEPGGYLFLGHAESVANVPVKFNQKIMNGTRLLQKPLVNNAAVGGDRP